jgi:hypothetical protein
METPENGSLPGLTNELSRRKMLLLGSGALAAIAVSAWAVPSISGVPVARAWTNGTPCPDGGREQSESTGAAGTSGQEGTSVAQGQVSGTSETSGECGTDSSSSGVDSSSDGPSTETVQQ